MNIYKILNEKEEILMQSCDWNYIMFSIDKLRTQKNIILEINHETKILFKKTNKNYLNELKNYTEEN